MIDDGAKIFIGQRSVAKIIVSKSVVEPSDCLIFQSPNS